MQHHRTLSGVTVPLAPIALGTAVYGTVTPEATAFQLMDRYAERGGNLLDSGHVYAEWLPGGRGQSERTIGRWLKSRGVRKNICVGTKGAHPDMKTGRRRVTRADVTSDLHESLERLDSSYIDIYWLHRDDPDVPVEDILGWLGEFRAAGLIHAIGCSNWTVARQCAAREEAARLGVPGFCASQIGWNLAALNYKPNGPNDSIIMDDDIRAYHRAARVPLVAFESQARGFFSEEHIRFAPHGQPTAGLPVAHGDGEQRGVWAKYGSPVNVRRREAAARLAARKGVSPSQIALAYLLNQDFPVFPIVGPINTTQLDDSCGAAEVVLTQEELRGLECSA